MAAGGESAAKTLQKSYFDVLGLCCSSEVPLVENILKSLGGVKEFHVIVPTKTVVVIHDTLIISPLQIVKALNQGRLEANVRVNGEGKHQRKLPSPYAMATGFLLSVSLFKFVYPPLHWVALGAVAVGILPIFLKALASLRNYRIDTNLLMLIAALNITNWYFYHLRKQTMVGTIALTDYIEAGAIVFLFTIAEWLESRAGHKAQAEMSSLMSRTPQKAVVAETGEEVDVDEVKLSTVLAVRGGEVIPIDGIVVDGNCEVDEKTLTGESFPVSKQIDSTVWAGTININGYISVKTTALAEDCVVAKMAQLVEDAQNSKTKTQRFIDKCAQYYTPAVILISATIALVPLVVKVHNRDQWFHLALVVLVSACPCALILSTPVATFCALTKAAKAGLLIKGGEYLETLAKIKAMAFDKTGTITRGEFVVTHFQSLSHCINLEELLFWAASIESKSSHPMAAALIDYASTFSIQPKPENVVDFRNFPGEGIHGKIDGRDVYIGNRKISLRAGSSTVPTLEPEISRGKTVGYIYCGASPAGIFTLSDVCRTGASEAIRDLKLLGIKTAMLTGDSEAAALHVQGQLEHGVEVVHAELLPEDKARIIQELKKEGPTAMIGDGVNDAPALATADIGISMGISGSALATETGHVILMSNDIRKVPKAIKLARKAHRKVVENVVLSISTKAAILALAIAGHPLVWAAVLADVGTCVLVILNSMLLLRHRSSHDGCKTSAAQHNHKHGHNNLPHSHNKGCCSKNVGNTCKAETTSCASKCQSSHLSLNACSDNKCADTAARQHQNCTGAGEVLEEKKPCCQSRGCSSANRKTESPKSYKQECPNNKRTDTTERQHQNCTGADEVVEEKKPCCQGQGCSSANRKTESPKSHKQQCSSMSSSGSGTKRDECGNVEEKVDNITGENDLDGAKVKRRQHLHCEKASECCSKSVGEIAGVELHGEHVDKCCKKNSNESHVTIDISEDDHEHHVETRSSRHGCKSLENREMGGCCKSYMKECCGSKHGQFATGFAGTFHEITIKEA